MHVPPFRLGSCPAQPRAPAGELAVRRSREMVLLLKVTVLVSRFSEVLCGPPAASVPEMPGSGAQGGLGERPGLWTPSCV